MKIKKILKEVAFLVIVLAVAGVISGFIDLSPSKTKEDKEAKVIEITEEEFRQVVFDYTEGGEWKYKGTKPAIIDFYADWCGPCKRLRPRLETIAKEYGDQILVLAVDTDRYPHLTNYMGVSALPTIFFIPKEGVPTKSVGLLRLSQIRSQVDEILLGKTTNE